MSGEKKIGGIVVTLALLMIFSGLMTGFSMQQNKGTQFTGYGEKVTIKGFTYTSHAPIRINGDYDFTAANGVIGGSGTKEDPYIISGWDIDAHGAGDAIYIGNTTKYFVVRDCQLHNASSSSWPYFEGDGITLYNVKNGTIENNTIYNNGGGIYLEDSSNNTITSNTIYNNSQDGIYMWYSGSNRLYGNKLTNNGIFLDGDKSTFTTQDIPTNNTVNGKPVYYYKNANMHNATVPLNAGQVILGNVSWLRVENLKISKASVGIEVGYSSNITIASNTIYNNSQDGIDLESSSNNVLTNNIIYKNGNGIYLGPSSSITITNNTIYNNSRDGIYLCYSSSNTVTSNTIYNNSGAGIYLPDSSSNTLANNTIYNNPADGIYLWYSSSNTLANNTIYNNSDSIFLCCSSSNTITSNTIYNNPADGIYLEDSSKNVLTNNIIYKNWNGIYLDSSNSITITWSNTITSNTIYNNSEDGIRLWDSISNTLASNTIYNNDDGIYLYSSISNTLASNTIYNNDDGIYLVDSSNNVLTNNIIYKNGNGIYLDSSSSITITNNGIRSNYGYGVYIDSGSNNRIYSNTFAYNNGSNSTYNYSHIQACDDGSSNYWDTSKYGNYWLDWAENNDTNDENHDGIVDWPYRIDGSAGAKDYYPLKNRTVIMVPLPPQNLQAKAGDGYVNLTWSAPADNGGSAITEYRIYRNGTLIATVPASRLWYNDTNVTPGQTYIYYVTAVNSVGESDKSNEVQATPSGAVPEFSAMYAVTVVLLVALVILRRRRS
ncbi:parallel beta-helix repeat (two copies) [Aciduliprofundum sp. MAR08-339]|uniref:right-handed parallel beta-helix repeat-containing protein n=1 Tax=Aciduliprofundum sp. (strain MAR08-339) TaxID=673860 RepID=UPI0002A4B971|nr:parallel beta-helix repeat (two copies) [Aciduliprofundum sp. MAR08-339]